MPNCERCLTPFVGYRDFQRFCSLRCQGRARVRLRAKYPERKCVHCGKVFRRGAGTHRGSHANCCSDECRAVNTKRRALDGYYRRRQEKPCLLCGVLLYGHGVSRACVSCRGVWRRQLLSKWRRANPMKVRDQWWRQCVREKYGEWAIPWLEPSLRLKRKLFGREAGAT